MMQPLLCHLTHVEKQALPEPEIVALLAVDMKAREYFIQRADASLQIHKMNTCTLRSLAALMPAPPPGAAGNIIRPRFGRG